jgi:tetratricopeptide (TPR) repeat protein
MNKLISFIAIAISLFPSNAIFSQNLHTQILNADNDSLLVVIQQCKTSIENDKLSAEEITSCGLSAYQRGEITHARDFFILAKNSYRQDNDSLNMGKMLANIGVTYELEGNYSEAINAHHKAMEIFTKINDTDATSKAMNNLGVVFQEINNSEKALYYYHSALNLKQENNDSAGIASTLNNIGVVFEENLNQPDSALHYYQYSLKYYKLLKNNLQQARLLSNISAIYVQKSDFKTAIRLIKEGEQIATTIKDELTINNIHKNAGYAHLKAGNFEKAWQYINQGLENSIHQNFLKNRIDFLALLAELQEKQSDYKNCIVTLKEYQHLKDSLHEKEKLEAISKQEVLFDTKRKEQQIKIAEQALMFSEFELKRQKDLLILAVFSFVLTGFIVLLLIYRYRLKSKNRQITLENKMLRSQMNPHFMFNALGAIQNYMLEHSSMESIIYLLDFSKLMRNILDASRAEEITIEKEIETLDSYLKLQQLRFSNKFEYQINIDQGIDVGNTSLPPMLLQPFIENAIEHGMRKFTDNKKGFIQLDIKKSVNKIQLQISDNGPGFNMQNITKKPEHISHAMDITKERIRAINHGKKFKITMHIKNEAEQGIVVNFEIQILK